MWVALDLFFGVSHLLVVGADFFYRHFGLLIVTGCVEVMEESRRYLRDRGQNFWRGKFAIEKNMAIWTITKVASSFGCKLFKTGKDAGYFRKRSAMTGDGWIESLRFR